MRPVVVIDGIEWMPVPCIRPTDGTLGQVLKGRRTMLELTLDKAAGRIGCSKAYLWELEKDQSMPKLDMATKIARAYGVPLGVLAACTLQPNSNSAPLRGVASSMSC